MKALLVAALALRTLGAPEEYAGTTFAELREKILRPVPERLDGSEPEVELEPYRHGDLPAFRTSLHALVGGIAAAAKRAVDDPADWAPRLPKLVHTTGICFTGEWAIDADSLYTGAFRKGFHGLFIGRASSANGKTVAGKKRPFGFAGKIFPTLDPEERVRTFNFVTIDNLGGTRARHFLDVRMTNEPRAGFAITPVTSLAILFAFKAADRDIFMRPIENLSMAGEDEFAPGIAPRWLRLRAAEGMPRVDEADFRHELDIRHYPRGLRLEIAVSATTKNPDLDGEWLRLGEIRLRESAVSYACDRQLRFAHSKVRR
jgi:hypothetical protein